MAVGERSPLGAAIAAALRAADVASAVLGVCVACADVLPCDGAAVTVMTSDAQRETVFAADEVIRAFERSQYNLGEGPSLVALMSRRPVLIPDMAAASTAARWPGLAAEVAALPIAAMFCFPMRFGVIDVGVCAFYRRCPGRLSSHDVSVVLDALDLTTLALLELRAGDRDGSLLGRWLAVDGQSRRQVHQATGMLMGQLGLSAESAFARLRGNAYARGSDVEQVADEIVNRRLFLEADPR